MSMRTWTLFALFVLLCWVGAQATPPKVVYQTDTLTPAYGPSYCASDDYLKQILEELKGLRKDVQNLKSGEQAKQDGIGSVIGSRCLSCHQDGKAQAKGGDFVLVEKDGTLSEQSLGAKRAIIRQVSQGKMPPSGKLPEGEVKVITEYFAPEKEQKK